MNIFSWDVLSDSKHFFSFWLWNNVLNCILSSKNTVVYYIIQYFMTGKYCITHYCITWKCFIIVYCMIGKWGIIMVVFSDLEIPYYMAFFVKQILYLVTWKYRVILYFSDRDLLYFIGFFYRKYGIAHYCITWKWCITVYCLLEKYGIRFHCMTGKYIILLHCATKEYRILYIVVYVRYTHSEYILNLFLNHDSINFIVPSSKQFFVILSKQLFLRSLEPDTFCSLKINGNPKVHFLVNMRSFPGKYEMSENL